MSFFTGVTLLRHSNQLKNILEEQSRQLGKKGMVKPLMVCYFYQLSTFAALFHDLCEWIHFLIGEGILPS